MFAFVTAPAAARALAPLVCHPDRPGVALMVRRRFAGRGDGREKCETIDAWGQSFVDHADRFGVFDFGRLCPSRR